MPLKEIFAPPLARNVKMGRKRPFRIPKLADYLDVGMLPVPPGSCDYTPAALQELVNVNLNDQLGDCVIAGGYHIVGTETGNAGNLFIATDEQVQADYCGACGYDPSDPNSDMGCDEPSTLAYWQQKGFANGTKILGWVSIDPTNALEVQQAMFLFENLFFGLELPDAWVNPFPDGNNFVWDVAGAPDPMNGHCVIGVGYDSKGVLIDTWGLIGWMTWAAIAKYVSSRYYGELYAILTPDQLAKGQTKAPNGIDWATLVADFDTMGGNVPQPSPAPPPVPPAPVPPEPPAPPAPPVPPTPDPVTILQQEVTDLGTRMSAVEDYLANPVPFVPAGQEEE